jgi:hypothetical protein
LGNLVEGEVQVVAKNDHQALIVRKSVHREPQVRDCRIGLDGWTQIAIDGFGLLDDPPPPASPLAPALVGHDGEQPGPELQVSPKAAEIPPRLEHGLLNRVLGFGFAPEHANGEAVGGGQKWLDKEHESLLVTGECVLNKHWGEAHFHSYYPPAGRKVPAAEAGQAVDVSR